MTPVVVLLFLAPLLFKADAYPVASKPVDCNDVFYQDRTNPSGVYTIYPSDPRLGIQVYCDMDTKGGPWTVILRRMDGTVNFYRGWDEYAKGFGDANGEYWLGLESMHKITLKKQRLLVEMMDFKGSQTSAMYSSFTVKSECDAYRLMVSGFTDGGAGDSLRLHNLMKFSTFDFDRDANSKVHCAKSHMGGFWYRNCIGANPTGSYLWGDQAEGAPESTGVIWQTWKGSEYSLKSITFKLHPM